MIKGFESLLIGSENAKSLADFYKDKVGLEIGLEAEMGEANETLYELKLGTRSPNIYIIDHSKVKGKNKNPQRIIFNIEVDDIEKEVKRLKSAQVRVVEDTYHVEGYGYIATFEDVDGNYFQLVQVSAS